MAFYSDVSAGDTILAAHPNALYDDISDLTAGHNHDGSNSRINYNAITTLDLATDFSTSSTSFTARTGATLTVTINNTGRLFIVTSISGYLQWDTATAHYINVSFRINRDSGTEYYYIGSSGIYTTTASQLIYYPNIDKMKYISGLSVGVHTFTLELAVGQATNLFINNCLSTPTTYHCRMFAMEV